MTSELRCWSRDGGSWEARAADLIEDDLIVHILLTGGTGFFGKALLRHWLAKSQAEPIVPKVTVLSRDPEKFRGLHPEFDGASWLDFLAGDVVRPETLALSSSVTHVLHAATDSTLGPSLAPLHRFNQIVEGTRHVLDLAVRAGARRFLLCSSGGVYGQPPPGLRLIEESYNGMPDPLLSQNAYSVGKRAAEHLCSLYAANYGVDVVVARCFAFVGRDLPLDVHFAIGNFIRDALYRPKITVAGDGTAVRSYLDQRDLAVWLTAMLERGCAGRAYNVGSDQAINMADLARLVRDVLSPEKKVEILGTAPLDVNRHVYVPSIERARRELGLDMRVTLQRAIKDAAVIRAKTC